MKRVFAGVILIFAVISACGKKEEVLPVPPTGPSSISATLQSISVRGDSEIRGRNKNVQLQALGGYSDGSSKPLEVQWSSSNTAVATVTSTGLVTSQSFGFVDIRATLQNFSGLISISVTQLSFNFEAVSAGCNVPTRCGSDFYKDGKILPGSYSRGFNVSAISAANGETINPVRGYDTWASRSTGTEMTDMIAYINSMPSGTLLLVSVSDEAGLTGDSISCLPFPTPGTVCCRPLSSSPWIENAQRLFESLGATQLRRYCYRNSYAFITVKGEGAKAERLDNAVDVRLAYTLTLP